MSKFCPTVSSASASPQELEDKHVHSVYSHIASHFSDTRYKPWPVVERFLSHLSNCSFGLDVGCGNGKYLKVNPKVLTFGTDRCFELLQICKQRGNQAIQADNLSLPFRNSSFDFVMSIAVIHHFSTEERRLAAIKELFRLLKKDGKIIIYVWAFEQKGRITYENQDIFVGWQLSAKKAEESSAEVVNFDRYYHLFQKGELDALVNQIDGFIIDESGYDRDNWYIIGHKLH